MKLAFKPFCIVSIIIMLIACSSRNGYGQIGWKWGQTAKAFIDSSGGGFDPQTIASDPSGNIFIVGVAIADSTVFGKFKVVNSGPGFHIEQLVVAKLDSSGQYKWAIGSYGSDVLPFGSATDKEGNIYVYGHFDSSLLSIGSFNLLNSAGAGFLMKVSPTGNVLWAQNMPYYLGGNIAVDSSGYSYVTGTFRDTITIGGTTLIDTTLNQNLFLVKFDPAGNQVWVKNFGGTCSMGATYIVAINDKVYLSGRYYGNDTNYVSLGSTTLTGSSYTSYYGAGYLAKFDSSGNSIWAKKISYNTQFNTIVADNSEYLYATGALQSQAILGKDTLNSAGLGDMVIAKLDSSGHFLWARAAGGFFDDLGYSLCKDKCGHIWVTGTMGGNYVSPYSVNFDGHTLSTLPTPLLFGDPTFIAEYDTAGNYLTGMAELSGGEDYVGLLAGNDGDFYFIGDYVFNPMVFGKDTLQIDSFNESLFIARYKYDTIGCNKKLEIPTVSPTEQHITLAPNPAYTELTITATNLINQVSITNVLGQKIFETTCNTRQVLIDLAQFSPGMYFMMINQSEVKKFIKR